MSEHTYLSMPTGVQFCSVCPYMKVGLRPRIVLCTTFSGEGRCEAHRDVPDTELPREYLVELAVIDEPGLSEIVIVEASTYGQAEDRAYGTRNMPASWVVRAVVPA